MWFTWYTTNPIKVECRVIVKWCQVSTRCTLNCYTILNTGHMMGLVVELKCKLLQRRVHSIFPNNPISNIAAVYSNTNLYVGIVFYISIRTCLMVFIMSYLSKQDQNNITRYPMTYDQRVKYCSSFLGSIFSLFYVSLWSYTPLMPTSKWSSYRPECLVKPIQSWDETSCTSHITDLFQEVASPRCCCGYI